MTDKTFDHFMGEAQGIWTGAENQGFFHGIGNFVVANLGKKVEARINFYVKVKEII